VEPWDHARDLAGAIKLFVQNDADTELRNALFGFVTTDGVSTIEELLTNVIKDNFESRAVADSMDAREDIDPMFQKRLTNVERLFLDFFKASILPKLAEWNALASAAIEPHLPQDNPRRINR